MKTKLIVGTILVLCTSTITSTGKDIYKPLTKFIEKAGTAIDMITEERKETLESLGDYVVASLEKNESAQLLYVCTHNSRRSQMSQMMAVAISDYFGIEGISAFSGGTETTALNPRAAAALKRAGNSLIEKGRLNEKNITYEASTGNGNSPVTLFSKVYDDDFNPKKDFVAVMVCSDADENCPLVLGADERISLPYDDPKAFDNTDLEAQKYDERLMQITTEIFYLFKYVKTKL